VDTLVRIKRLILAGNVIFTTKAALEMTADHLNRALVCEAIIAAAVITKKLRSKNPVTGERETLYVIKGLTYDGILIYTKGKIAKIREREVFYVLISSKRAID
jgi:hypothetical protein